MQNKGSLHNKFEGFGAQPSAKLWDSIASNLDQKKKRRVKFWWWFGSGLFAVTVLLIGLNLYQSNGHISEPIVSKNHNSTKNYTNGITDSKQVTSINNKEVFNPIGLPTNETIEAKTNTIAPHNKNTNKNYILNSS